MDSRQRSILLACFVLSFCMLTVSLADSSDAEITADAGDIRIHTFTDSATISTGESTTFTLALANNHASDVYQVEVSGSISPSSRMSVDVSEYTKSMDAGESQTLTVKVGADSTAVSGNYTVTVTVYVIDTTADTGQQSAEITIPVKVNSDYSSEGYYNKIMGIVESPFDDAYLSALITLAIWIGISILAKILVTNSLRKLAEKEDKDELRKDARSTGTFVMILVLFFGVPLSFRVSGIDERIIATVSDLVDVIIALNIAYLVWKAYKFITYEMIVRRDKNDIVDDSLYPLVKMIGKIAVVVVTLSYIMSVYGLDLGAIVTSAGLVTLAISLGAQSTLNQFFCGLVLLVTRPFRIGDKVRLGTDSEVLIVRKIGVMETEFKVWLNEEVQHIPNSTVMSSSIVNITKGDKTYKVVDYIDVDYSTDLDKAREIIMSIIQSHPRIVNDGSKSAPDFRLSSMESSALRIRISYIVYDHEYWHTVSCQVKEAIYKKFRASGIKVPHNIVDVHTE